MRKVLLNLVFWTTAFFTFGQKLNVVIDSQEIQIGEPLTLTFSVSNKDDIVVDYQAHSIVFTAKDGTKANDDNRAYELEILVPFRDTSYQEGEEYIWEGKYILTGWDSSFVVIPPEKIMIGDSLYYFPVQLIEVTSPPTDPNQEIYDINELFTEVPPYNFSFIDFLKKNWIWISIVIVLLIALFFKFRERKEETIVILNLKDKTLQQINELEASEAYNVDLKEYYFDLSLILKRFLSAHYHTSIMEKTTSELEHVLSLAKLDKEIISVILQLLTQSDMVKFAKSKPTLEEIKNVTNDARKVVIKISELEINNE